MTLLAGRLTFVLTCLVCGVAARADTAVLTPLKDNTIYSNGNSNGASIDIYSGRTGTSGGGVRQRALLAFDVASAVPAGATVTSVTLELTLLSTSNAGGDETHELHRVLRDWGEGTSNEFGGEGAPPTPGDATWTHTFYATDFWNNAGGDYAAAPSASAVVGIDAGAVYSWGSTAAMVADVQAWLDTPATSFGWLLLGNEGELWTAKKFASREFGAPSHPVLTIEFDPPDCPADCADPLDGVVDVLDFLELLSQWGGGGSCDLDGAGVSVTDLLSLLAQWGACTG